MDDEHFTTDGADQHSDPHHDPESPTPTRQPRKLPIRLLERSYSPPGDRSARSIQEEVVAALAADIEKSGLLNPLIVKPDKIIRGSTSVDGWRIIDGHNRWEAALRLGWKEIDCIDGELDERHRAVVTAASEGGAEILRFALGNTTLRQAIKRAEFNYDALDAVTAMKLRQAVIDIRENQAATVAGFARIGNSLIAAKTTLVPHGNFATWLASELGLRARTAENYMNLARFLDGNAKRVSDLPVRILYRLASPSAEPEIVRDVLAAADAGAPLAAKEITSRFAAAVEHSQEVAKATVQTPSGRRRKIRLTPEEAAEQVARKNAEREQEKAKQEQQKAKRQSRLKPLADRVIGAIGGDDLRQVLAALGSWNDAPVFFDLLRHGLAPGGSR